MPPEHPDPAREATLGTAVRQHERLLWALCYRMTGVAADADELVQETWLRCLERPPPDLERSLRPWLTRVAVNLARDHLRHRQSRAYIGPWLPSPVPLERTLPAPEHSPEDRLALAESARLGTLLALEKLSPGQRAIWLLREVFEHSIAETAELLELSEGAVKVGLHRARRALDEAREGGEPWTEGSREAAGGALVEFFSAVQAADALAARRALDEAAVLRSDGGGVVKAALRPILGPDRIARFYLGLSARLGGAPEVRLLEVNGGPALHLRLPPRAGFARDNVVAVEVDAGGRIRSLFSVLAPAKLAGLELSA